MRCTECGSTNFTINEELTWKAHYSEEDNEIVAFNKTCDITWAGCKDCNHDMTEAIRDDESITINWQ